MIRCKSFPGPVLLAVLCSLFSLDASARSAADPVEIVGGGPDGELFNLLVADFGAAHPEYRLSIRTDDRGDADTLAWVGRRGHLLGRLDQPLTPRLRREHPDARELPLADVPLTAIVGSDLGVEGLTLDQWRRIHAGLITNWSELGGPDVEIVPIGFRADTPTGRALLRRYPDLAEGRFARVCDRPQRMLAAVAGTRGALGVCEARALAGARGVAPLVVDGFACAGRASLVYDRRDRGADLINDLKNYLRGKRWRELLLAAPAYAPIARRAPDGAPLRLGLLWVGRSPEASAVARGLLARLREIAPDIEVETRMEARDADVAATWLDLFEGSKEGVVLLGDEGIELLTSRAPRVPVFVGACDRDAAAALIAAAAETGTPVTGAARHLPAADCCDRLREWLPGARRAGLLRSADDAAAAAELRAACAARGLELRELIYEGAAVPAERVAAFAAEVDALICLDRPELNGAARAIVAAAGDTPVCGFSEAVAKAGALFAVTVSDRELGGMLADSVVDVLLGHGDCAAIPLKTDPAPLTLVNPEARVARLSPPPGALRNAALVR